MERLLPAFIKEHPSDWKEILSKKPYFLRINDDDDENLMLVTYTSESDFSQQIVRESRGIVYDKNTMEVIAVAFDKFFNVHEKDAAEIDWTTARVTQKMDGSIVTLYWYGNRWNLKSNGVIHASRVTVPSNPSKNFRQLFDEAEKVTPINWDRLDKDVCYSFELMAPDNRIIIDYDKPMLTFLLARNRVTGDEIDYTPETNPTGVPMPLSFPFDTLDGCKAALKSFDDAGRKDVEGFVVCDANHNRIKLKTQYYLDAHHLRGELTLTVRNAIHLLRSGDSEEYLSYSPWRRQYVEDIKAKMGQFFIHLKFIKSFVNAWKEHNSDMTRGEFARYIARLDEWIPDIYRSKLYKSYFFSAFDGKMSDINTYIDNLPDARIENAITSDEFTKFVETFGLRQCDDLCYNTDSRNTDT